MATMALTLAQQRAIVRAIPKTTKHELKQHCQRCEQSGSGILDVLSSAGKFLTKSVGSLASKIGPTVLKELVYPMLRKKVGLGIRPAGRGIRPAGRGLRPAGAPSRRSVGAGKKKRKAPAKKAKKKVSKRR
jgi:hypothetical protein